MKMYFEKLKKLETIEKNDPLALDAIKKLDIWLVNLSHTQAEYINPLQFAEDYKIDAAIAAHVIEEAYKQGLFTKFYRVVSSKMEPLIDGWSKKQIEDEFEDNEIYSDIEDRYISIAECQFIIFYRLVDEPINLPKYITKPKKEKAPLYSNKVVEAIGDDRLKREYEGAW